MAAVPTRREGSADSTRITRAVKRTRTASVSVTWGRESESHFQLCACRDRAIEIEENAARAHVLRFRVELAGAFDVHYSRQPHIEAPHRPPFLRTRLHFIRAR